MKIQNGSNVVVKDLRGFCRIVRAGGNQTVRLGSLCINTDILLDRHYGDCLVHNDSKHNDGDDDFDNTRLPTTVPIADGEWTVGDPIDMQQNTGEMEDEEDEGEGHLLNDDNQAQALDEGAVVELKSAPEIELSSVVDKLTASSSSFQLKSKFAKAKYIFKKQRKHIIQLRLLRPTLFNLADYYEKHDSLRTCDMQVDALSVMLYRAGVAAASRALVIDFSMGLLTSACVQRMGGDSGRIFRATGRNLGEKALEELLGRDRVRSLLTTNVQEDNIPFMVEVPLNVIEEDDPRTSRWANPKVQVDTTGADDPLYKNGAAHSEQSPPCVESDSSQLLVADHSSTLFPHGREVKLTGCSPDTEMESVHPSRPTCGHLAEKNCRLRYVEDLIDSGVDSVLILLGSSRTPLKPEQTLHHVLTGLMDSLCGQYLRPSGTFVAFGNDFESLALLEAQMKRAGVWTFVRLEEYFKREYQVLPGRTHPIMGDTKLFSGFILSAIRVSAN
eukprot:Lankesteria_metandrocarpae@DN5159_c0_g1_i1.p1